MADFRELSDEFLVSPQLEVADVADASEQGVTLIVNNRPDGEDPTAPQGDEIEEAAKAAGIDYLAIPIGHSGFSLPQIDTLLEAVRKANGKVLGYCRSGTRSTFLWALSRAKLGDTPEAIAAAAARGGYDISPIQPTVDMLAGEARNHS